MSEQLTEGGVSKRSVFNSGQSGTTYSTSVAPLNRASIDNFRSPTSPRFNSCHHHDTHNDTMPVPRPSVALRAANSITTQSSRAVLAPSPSAHCQSTRTLSSTSSRAAADHGAHEDHYDPPSGWLWGIKPGEKPEKEGWENIYLWGMFGSLGLAAVAYAFKPDTS